jgi:hypothetical protein
MSLSVIAANPMLAGLSWYQLDSGTREWAFIGGALALLVIGLVLWAIYLRKPSRRKDRHSARSHRRQEEPEPDGEHGDRRRARRKRRRSEEAPRNPTRAETGGLPGRPS